MKILGNINRYSEFLCIEGGEMMKILLSILEILMILGIITNYKLLKKKKRRKKKND